MSFWTQERQPIRLQALMRPQLLLLLPVACGIFMFLGELELLLRELRQGPRSPLTVPVFAGGMLVAVGMTSVALWELVRVLRWPPAKYPGAPRLPDLNPKFDGVEKLGQPLRVSTATAAARAYFLTGILLAVGWVWFLLPFLLGVWTLPPDVFLMCGGALLLPIAMAIFGYHRFVLRVWVFREGIAVRRARSLTMLKWDKVKWLVTTVGFRLFPDERSTELGTNDGCFITIPTELDDPDAVAELVVELCHENMYPRLLNAMERGSEIRFGPFSLSAAGIRYGKDETTPWSRIGEIKLVYGTHIGVWKREIPYPWIWEVGKDMPNAWLFLRLTQVLHPYGSFPSG